MGRRRRENDKNEEEDSPVIYSYITTDEVHEASKQCTLEDIQDCDLRKFIEEVYMWIQLVKLPFFWILVFSKFT